MYKVAVIGDRESVLGFRALGLVTVAAATAEEAAEALHRLAKEGCAIVYITEQLAARIPADVARYIEDPHCAVIPIPSKDGALGIGQRELHQAVERAVGADILKKKED
ncbi:MAG: V-type ATP synthase subunit F [Clostridiaceae bacterium]|nr:V-type ATP synthase subunit F [Clostridiaceae bacterium]